MEEKAFFEFHWAFFIRLFSGPDGTLWLGSPHVARGFGRLMATAKQTPASEFLGRTHEDGEGGDEGRSSLATHASDYDGGGSVTLGELIAFSEDVSQPLFGLLVSLLNLYPHTLIPKS